MTNIGGADHVGGDAPILGMAFDVGGVFTTRGGDHFNQIRQALSGFGLEMQDMLAEFFGEHSVETKLGGRPFTTEDMRPIIASELTDRVGERADEVAALIVSRYTAPVGPRRTPGIMELVGELTALGIRVGILSNGPADGRASNEVLESGLFHASVISGVDGVGKPDRAAFDLIAERLEIPLANLGFVDDTQSHVDSARELGIRAFRFASYEHDISHLREQLRDAGLGIA